MDVREIIEKSSRATDQIKWGAVAINGKRVDTRLYIGEVVQEQLRHIGIDAVPIGHRRMGAKLAPRLWRFASVYVGGKLAKQEAVADVPSYAR
jgi:hypothetical protein